MKEPKVELQQVKVESFDLQFTTIGFELILVNENDFDISVESIDYQLYLNKKSNTSDNNRNNLVSEGKIKDLPTIKKAPAKGSEKTIVYVPIKFDTQKVVTSLIELVQLGELEYEFLGHIKTGPWKLKFNKKDNLKLKK